MIYNIAVHKKKNLATAKIIIFLVLLSFLFSSLLPLFASSTASTREALTLHEKQEILSNLNRQKITLAEKLKEARLKEAFANEKLKEINGQLSQAQKELSINQRYLEANKQAWAKTRARLMEIKEQKSNLEQEAQNRVLAIYKQDRLKLIDGLINSSSVTEYLDHLYYQKRVMEHDRNVLSALVDQSESMKKYNETLEKETQKIQEITGRLKNIERQITAQKDTQKEVLQKLQNEREVYESTERQLEKESIKLVYKVTELSGSSDRLDNPEATGSFIYPLNGKITSPFGPRRHPIFGVTSMHSGIDIAAPRGTPVLSSEGGLVIYAGWYGGYGKVVIIDHSKGYSTLYAHLQSIRVRVGKRIRQGTVIGYEGDTGYATGPHVHFEVRSKGKPQNPIYYLSNDEAAA
jgi:murein DD-endopeptidase MepM/ murein hydrolase activator NlpD